MRLEISPESFDIVRQLLSNTYLELIHQRDMEKNQPSKNKQLSDTAEVVRCALKEIGIAVSPTRAELDKEGNFK